MLELNERSYAAIITIKLPPMAQAATITVTLSPPAVVQVAPGKVKALRDCSLLDLRAFADALEAEIWASYQTTKLAEIASNEESQLKITILDQTGEPLELEKDAILEHAIQVESADKQDAEQMSGKQDYDESGYENTAVEETDTESARWQTAETLLETATEPADGADESVADEELPETSAANAAAVAESSDVIHEFVDEDAPVESDIAHETEERPAEELRIAGLRRPLGHPTKAAVDILINEPVFRKAQTHALSSLDREVAGMLIGPRPEKQPDGRYVVHITDVIIAKHTRMQGASVTYTPESWRYVTDVINERYPNEEAVFVGWYHTHPGFGIFLSGMDLFIHQNFFTQKWHVALVLDPIAQRSGFFCWDRAQTAIHQYDFPWPEWAAGAW